MAATAQRLNLAQAEIEPAKPRSINSEELYRYAYWVSLCSADAARLTRAILRDQQLGSHCGSDLVTLLVANRPTVLCGLHVGAIDEPIAGTDDDELGSLRQAIASLDVGDRELLALQECLHLSLRQVSVVVGDSEAAVRRRLAAIRRTLLKSIRNQRS